MKATEIIKNLKLAFDEMLNQTQQKFIDAMLKDGTMVSVTELAIGGIVTIDGIPAPTGEHILEDGTTIVLGDNGAITEIKPAEPTAQVEIEVEGKKEEDMTAKFSAFETSTLEKFSSYEEKFKQYEQRFADYENKLNNAHKVIGLLKDLTQQLADSPTGEVDEAVKSSNTFATKEKKENSYDILFSKK
jgi:hypothetical protein